MKEFVTVIFFEDTGSFLYRRGRNLDASLFAEMQRRWPQFQQSGRHGLNLKLEVGTQLQQEVFDFLAHHGKKPRWTHYPSIRETESIFQLSGERIFDENDYQSARYIEMCPKKRIAGEGCFEDDCRLWVRAGSVYFKVKLGTYPCGLFLPAVDEAMMQKLEEQKFSNLLFRPIEIRGESPRGKKLWQLWSDVVLPPVIDELIDTGGLAFDPAKSTSCVVQDLYLPMLCRYHRSDIDALGSFDFALTREHWGAGYRAPKLFVAKHVYQWFHSQGVLEAFIPMIEQ